MGPQILVFSMNPMGYPILTPSWWWIWRWLLIFWKVTTWGIPKRGSLIFWGGRRFLGRKSWGRGWVWRWNLWSWQSQKNAWKALRSSHCMWSHCWWTLRHSAFGGAATAATKTLGSVGSIRSWEIPELHGTLGITRGKLWENPRTKWRFRWESHLQLKGFPASHAWSPEGKSQKMRISPARILAWFWYIQLSFSQIWSMLRRGEWIGDLASLFSSKKYAW
jgi:hypothetical protein